MNTRAWEKYKCRHAARYAKEGRKLEELIKSLLQELRAENIISDFTYHPPFSKPDQNGEDFTVRVGNREFSFGVTISLKSYKEAKLKHPNVPQFHFPIGMNPDTMKRRIVELTKAKREELLEIS